MLAGILGFVDPEGTQAGSVTILPIRVEEEVPEMSVPADLNVEWKSDSESLNIRTQDGKTVVSYENIGDWQNINATIGLEAKQTVITMKVTNDTDHKAKYKLSTMYTAEGGAWADVGGDNTPAVVYIEIAAGESAELTITLTAEQAAQAEFIMFMLDVENLDGASGPRSGNAVIESLTVSTALDSVAA